MARLLLLPVFGVLLLASAPARAGTLTNATWFQVTEGVPMTRTFSPLGAAGSSTSSAIAVSLSYPLFSTTIFRTSPAVTLALRISQGGPQFVTATAAMASGSPGVPGTVIVMNAGHVAMGVNQSMFVVGAFTLVRVPLSHGRAGQFSGTFTVVGMLHSFRMDVYAWTPGTLTFTGLTTKGAPLPTVVAMGSFDLDSAGAGTVTLVSPSRISIDGSLWERRRATFTQLVLTFVPEPGTLLLLGASGMAALLAGRRTRR